MINFVDNQLQQVVLKCKYDDSINTHSTFLPDANDDSQTTVVELPRLITQIHPTVIEIVLKAIVDIKEESHTFTQSIMELSSFRNKYFLKTWLEFFDIRKGIVDIYLFLYNIYSVDWSPLPVSNDNNFPNLLSVHSLMMFFKRNKQVTMFNQLCSDSNSFLNDVIKILDEIPACTTKHRSVSSLVVYTFKAYHTNVGDKFYKDIEVRDLENIIDVMYNRRLGIDWAI
jgi:hypothetical protein